MGKKTRIVLITLTGFLVAGVSWQLVSWLFGGRIDRPADIDYVLWACRKVCANVPGEIEVTLKQEHGLWQVAELNCFFIVDNLNDSMLKPIRTLRTIDSLRFDIEPRSYPNNGNQRIKKSSLKALANLRDLRNLAVPWACIEANPEPLFALSQLESLDLRGKYHIEATTTQAFEQLKNLRNLRQLNLPNYGLSDGDMKYLKPLKQLEVLSVGESITDTGLEELKELENLRSLSIETLGTRGLLSLKNLPHLEHLEVNKFDPSSSDSDLSLLTGLKWLSIKSIEDERKELIQLPLNLDTLEVTYEAVQHLDMQSARNIQNVRMLLVPRLNRDWKYGTESIDLSWLASMPELTYLRLDSPDEEDVKAIASLRTLRGLRLDAGCMSRIGEEGMSALADLQQLTSLTIRDEFFGNRPIENGLEVLPKLPNLQVVSLIGFREVNKNWLPSLRELKHLWSLDIDLYNHALIDEALVQICLLTDLEELSIREYGGVINDQRLSNLAHLKKLRRLDLGALEGYSDHALVSLIKELPNLQELKRIYSLYKK